MTEKTAKRIRWAIGILFLLAFILNTTWQGKGYIWTYWAAGFLIGGELLIVGLFFIVFPKQMMRVLIENEKDYNGISTRRLIISGLVAGIPTFLFGIYFLSIVYQGWIIECSHILDCI